MNSTDAFVDALKVMRLLLERGAAGDSPSQNSALVMPRHSAAARRHRGSGKPFARPGFWGTE